MKTVLFASDWHCGHRLGLVPPRWQEKTGEAASIQREVYAAVEKALAEIGPIDIAVLPGDLVDGPGTRSGATELFKPADDEQHRQDKIGLQLDIAEECSKMFKAKRTEIVCGTPYHVGDGVLQEAILAKRIGASFHYELDLNVNGLLFNVKHHVGSSQVWHGRATAPLRSQSWKLIRAAMDGAPPADVIVRAHVHFFLHARNAAGHVITLPCLQAMSRFGTLRLDSMPDLGMVVFRVKDRATWSCEAHLFHLRSLERKEVKA